MGKLFLKGAVYNGEKILENQVVEIEEERIVFVGEKQIPQNVEVIDAKDGVILPGLADMHVHLGASYDGEGVDPLSYEWMLHSLLYAGVTTVFDMGNLLSYVLQLRGAVRKNILGPSILCVGPLLDGVDSQAQDLSFIISSSEQIPAIVELLVGSGVNGLKAYNNLTFSQVKTFAKYGQRFGLPLIMDAGWENNGNIDYMRAGINIWAHHPWRKLEQKNIDYMVRHNIPTITTLSSHESFTNRRLQDLSFLDCPLIRDVVPTLYLDKLQVLSKKRIQNQVTTSVEETFKIALSNVKAMLDNGVLVVAGTDAMYPGVFYGEGLHRELELLVEAGFSPLQAIDCATINAAKLMKQKDWGAITAGMRADMIIVNGRPDKNISDIRNIETVIQFGKVINRDSLVFNPETKLFNPVYFA